jgi:hypothetical protein
MVKLQPKFGKPFDSERTKLLKNEEVMLRPYSEEVAKQPILQHHVPRRLRSIL